VTDGETFMPASGERKYVIDQGQCCVSETVSDVVSDVQSQTAAI